MVRLCTRQLAQGSWVSEDERPGNSHLCLRGSCNPEGAKVVSEEACIKPLASFPILTTACESQEGKFVKQRTTPGLCYAIDLRNVAN